jgi:hypothetical protein
LWASKLEKNSCSAIKPKSICECTRFSSKIHFLNKYFDSFVIAAGVEDKSPEHREKRTKKELELITSKSLELKPYYLDKDRVKSRLFGEIQSDSVDVDWKNLEKLTKEAISKAGLNIYRLVSLKKVLDNELTRLKKQDEKYQSMLDKVTLSDRNMINIAIEERQRSRRQAGKRQN